MERCGVGLGPQFCNDPPPLNTLWAIFWAKNYILNSTYVMKQSNDILCDDCDSIPEVNGFLLIVKCN